jgi:hypothetical protein
MMPETEKIPSLRLDGITYNANEFVRSPRLKKISETDERIVSVNQNSLIPSSFESELKKSPRLLKSNTGAAFSSNLSELKKSPRLQDVANNEPTSQLRKSLPQVSAAKIKGTPRKRSSTLNSDVPRLIKNKSLRKVRESQEILQRIHIRKEIIFAKNFLNTLESIPNLVKKTSKQSIFY